MTGKLRNIMARKKSAEAKPPKVKKRRWYHQVREVFVDVQRQEPNTLWIILGILVGSIAVAIGIGFAVGHPYLLGFAGLLVAIPISTWFLGRRAERQAYARIEGEPGAVSAALGTIRRGWSIENEPIAVDPRTRDMVFRIVGRPGVVLISEGASHRVERLLRTEERKVQRVIPNVPVTHLQSGREEGQIPLPKLVRTVQKLKPQLNKHQVSEISRRMRALQQTRLPIPKGVDPMKARPDRRAMRGR